jgi:DNA adenine methylase
MDERPLYRRAPKPPKTERQQIFVRNLRWAQERLGLTLLALAKQAEVDEDWLRRAATQGILWTKRPGKKAVEKLEKFLGCPPNTLWESDGQKFREGVTHKHLRVRDPVTDFEVVYRHYETNPPPILNKLIEIIADLRRGIDDPSHQPATGQVLLQEPPKEQLSLEQDDEVVVTWKPGIGWKFSNAAITQSNINLQKYIDKALRINVPGASEIHVGMEEIYRLLSTDGPIWELGVFAWLQAFEQKTGMSPQDTYRLIEQKEAEYEAKQAEEAAQRQAARMALQQPAQLLLDSLPEDVRTWYFGRFRRTSSALVDLQEELNPLLAANLTVSQAIEKAIANITQEFKRSQRHESESPELDDSVSDQAEVLLDEPVLSVNRRPRVRSKIPDEPKLPKELPTATGEPEAIVPVLGPGISKLPVRDDQVAFDDAPTNLQHVLIKWTGSKHRQAREIIAQFPRRINTYYEPFVGGGSVLYELLGRDVDVRRYEVSDLCKSLIELCKVIRDEPTILIDEYESNWRMLQSRGANYYQEIRREFNQSQNPHLFFFLLRTCRNGLVRFNQAGEFNAAFHGDRPGMDPKTVKKIAGDWKLRLASKDVHFSVRDYRQITATEGDFLYLDPPYRNKDGKYYYGRFDLYEFFAWLRGQPCDYAFSLNGYLGDEDRTVDVPTDLYDGHMLLDNGFDRLNNKDALPVKDSLYIRRRGSNQPGSS